jgi:rare lipoprotein A
VPVIVSILTLILTASVYGQELTASWYSEASLIKEGTRKARERQVTASGQLFSDKGLTAASIDYFGKTVRVIRTDTKASVVVLVNDKTARRFQGKRIDLSKEAFSRIADLKSGVVPVTVEVIK